MKSTGVGVEEVSLSELEALNALMSSVESTPAAPNYHHQQRGGSSLHRTPTVATSSSSSHSAFRPASSLPPPAPSSSFAPSAPSSPFLPASAAGNRPHASRFQVPSGTQQVVASSSPAPLHAGARVQQGQVGGARVTPGASPYSSAAGRPSTAAAVTNGPQLRFTSTSAPSSTTTPDYSRGATRSLPMGAAGGQTPVAAATKAAKPHFENPYQKQQEEREKSYGFSYTPAETGSAAGGRSTHNRFNKNPSIFNSTAVTDLTTFHDDDGYDADHALQAYDDFQSSSQSIPSHRGPPSSAAPPAGFDYPSPSSAPRGPPQHQQQQQQPSYGNNSRQPMGARGGPAADTVSFPRPRPPTFSGNAPPAPIDVQLVDKDQFGAGEPHKRDKWLSDFYASVPGSKFDALSKMWTFPLSCYSSFTKVIEDTRGVTLNGPLPPWIMRLFVYKEKKPLNMNVQLDKIPVDLLNALYPFQREGVMFALQRNGRALIADEMGLGKTLQAIAVAAYYKEDWPVLVVAPSSVRVLWAEAFEKWIPGLRSDQIKVIMKTKDNPDGLVNIISYDLVVRQASDMIKKNFRIIIADESHTIKSWKAKRTTNLQPLLKDARRCILLTGTPALSRPEELFTQLHSLDSQVFTRMIDFGVRYCAGHQTRFCWDYSGSSNLKELYLLLQETVMIRRLKCDVLGQLPSKKRLQVFLGIIDKHKKIIGNINDKIKEHKKMCHIAHSTDAAKSARFEAWRLIKELYHNTGTAKLPAVTEYIKEMLKTKNKILVFAYHHDVMDGIGLLLEREGIEYIRIDGMTPPQHRQELVDYYQNQPNCRAAVLGLTSAGVGLTMTKAEAVIMTELYWNPGILRQAEDRAHRIGVEHEVEVFYLVARGTLDESIWDMIRHKLDVLGNTLNGEQEVLEAEEVEGKAPDGSTIDVFMEKILQKVETFEEREKAYQERKLQQHRDAEMMNQIIREDQQSMQQEAAPQEGFQPATIYFDAADSILEAAGEELEEVMESAARAKGKTARGITMGRGGKIIRPSSTPTRASKKRTAASTSARRSTKRKQNDVDEEEEEEAVRDEDEWESVVVDDEETDLSALPSWSAKRAMAGSSFHDRTYTNGDDDDDDFQAATPQVSLRATPSSSRTPRSSSASSTPRSTQTRKKRRVAVVEEPDPDPDFEDSSYTAAVTDDAEQEMRGLVEEQDEADHHHVLPPPRPSRSFAQQPRPTVPAPSARSQQGGDGPMPRAGQLGRFFSFGGGRRLANRD